MGAQPPGSIARETPMSNEVEGEKGVVIASGGYAWYNTAMGDYIVAFALHD